MRPQHRPRLVAILALLSASACDPGGGYVLQGGTPTKDQDRVIDVAPGVRVESHASWFAGGFTVHLRLTNTDSQPLAVVPSEIAATDALGRRMAVRGFHHEVARSRPMTDPDVPRVVAPGETLEFHAKFDWGDFKGTDRVIVNLNGLRRGASALRAELRYVLERG